MNRLYYKGHDKNCREHKNNRKMKTDIIYIQLKEKISKFHEESH